MHEDIIIARDVVGTMPYVYRIALHKATDGVQRWRIEFRMERGGSEWESALMGTYDTKDEALEAFVPRYRTIDISTLEALHPIIAKAKAARLQHISDAAAQDAVDRQAEEALRQRRAERVRILEEGLKNAHFHRMTTHITGENRKTLSEKNGPSYKGLTITSYMMGRWKRYSVTHQLSGLCVSQCLPNLRSAKMWVFRVTRLINFERPAEEVTNAVTGPINIALKRLGYDPWADISDLIDEEK